MASVADRRRHVVPAPALVVVNQNGGGIMNGLMNFLDAQKMNSLLLNRVLMSIILITAGYGKLFGEGPAMISEKWAASGMIAGGLLGYIVPVLEFFGGIAILLGIAPRVFAIWTTIQFALIVVYVRPMVFGAEFNTSFADIALVGQSVILAAMGGGAPALGSMILKGKRWAE
jgi:uncharacterized membrane protein YphA (DoxX/SURF4 family)